MLVAGLCVLGLTYNHTGRQLLPPLLIALRGEFGLTHFQSSAMLTVFSMIYAVVQALVGFVSLVVGRRKVLLLSTIAYAIVLAITSYAPTYETLLILQVIGALAAGNYFITGLSMVATATSDLHSKGFFMGLYLCGGSLGAVMSSVVSGLALKHWTWRIAYRSWGLLGIPIAVLMWKYLPKDNELVEDADSRARRPVLSEGAITVTYAFLVLGMMLNSVKMWGLNAFLCSFLSEAKGFTQASAAAVYGGIRGVGVLGQMAMGVLSDSIGKLQTTILSTGVGAVTICLPLANYGRPYLFAALALYGFVCPMASGSFMASIHHTTPPESWDVLTGFANSLNFVGAAVGPAMVGKLIDSSGFNAAFLTTAALAVLSSLMSYFALMTYNARQRGRREKGVSQ
jgi:predicted MFS family arabinose efflux permease